MRLLKEFKLKLNLLDVNHMLAFDFSHRLQPQLYLKKGKRYNRIESYDDNA